MPGVPAFILRRLYVKGSLHRREDGWGFELRNSLGSGYARQLLPLTIDGVEVPPGDSYFRLDGHDVAFPEVSETNTFALKMNRTILIYVKGDHPAPGTHKVGMAFVVPGFGRLAFDFSDDLADASPKVDRG